MHYIDLESKLAIKKKSVNLLIRSKYWEEIFLEVLNILLLLHPLDTPLLRSPATFMVFPLCDGTSVTCCSACNLPVGNHGRGSYQEYID